MTATIQALTPEFANFLDALAVSEVARVSFGSKFITVSPKVAMIHISKAVESGLIDASVDTGVSYTTLYFEPQDKMNPDYVAVKILRV